MSTMPIFDCPHCKANGEFVSYGYYHRYFIGAVLPDGREINIPYTVYLYHCNTCGYQREMEYDGERLVVTSID